MHFKPRPLKWPPVFPLDKGLVAWYTFDERSGSVVKDRSGKGNDGALTGGTRVAAPRGSALTLNGSTDIITVPDADSLDLTTAISIVFMLKLNAAPGFSARLLVKDNGYGTDYALLVAATRIPGFYTTGGIGRGSFITALTVGAWTQVAVTWGSVQTTPTSYINGVVNFTSPAWAGPLSTNAYPLYIGSNSTKDRGLSCTLRSLRLYNRVLTAAEIKRLYESEIRLVRH